MSSEFDQETRIANVKILSINIDHSIQTILDALNATESKEETVALCKIIREFSGILGQRASPDSLVEVLWALAKFKWMKPETSNQKVRRVRIPFAKLSSGGMKWGKERK